MKNTSLHIIIGLISFSSLIQLKTFGQSGIILNIPANDTLLLKGIVNVLHGPDHYYKDTTFVEYIHYVMIYKEGEIIRYHEIFDSPVRDSLMFDSYTFQIKNDTMYFFTEKEFLNFTGFGKTLFLSYPSILSEKSIKATPRVLKTDTINKWGIDNNYFDFFNFNPENIIAESKEFTFKKGEKVDSVSINLFESRQDFTYIQGIGYCKSGVFSNLKKINGVLDSTGYYLNLEFHETSKYSKKNCSYTQITQVYNRMENIPQKILNYLK